MPINLFDQLRNQDRVSPIAPLTPDMQMIIVHNGRVFEGNVQDIANLVQTSNGLWNYVGAIDCSTNPNYPAATAGDVFSVSASGRIGGAAGSRVEAGGDDAQDGDSIICITDTAGGDQATAGVDFLIVEGNRVELWEPGDSDNMVMQKGGGNTQAGDNYSSVLMGAGHNINESPLTTMEGVSNNSDYSPGGHHEGNGNDFFYSDFAHAEGVGNAAGYAPLAHLEGQGNEIAYSASAHAQGQANEIIYSDVAHAEGVGHSLYMSAAAHAEGQGHEVLYSSAAHAEGVTHTINYSDSAHSEGQANQLTYSPGSHAEGVSNTVLYSQGSHVEGVSNLMEYSNSSHIEGQSNRISYSAASHAEGQSNIIEDYCEGSHAEGVSNRIAGYSESNHVEGVSNLVQNYAEGNHVEGISNIVRDYSDANHVEGVSNLVHLSSGVNHIEGISNIAQNSAYGNHIEGTDNIADGVTFSRTMGASGAPVRPVSSVQSVGDILSGERGSSQVERVPVRATTTSAAPVDLTDLDGNQIAIPLDMAMRITGRLIAVLHDDNLGAATGTIGDTAMIDVNCDFKNLAGTTSLPISQVSVNSEGAATFGISVAADDLLDVADIRVSGAANETTHWVGYMDIAQAGFRNYSGPVAAGG